MTYELECGHCGCGFALPGPLARAVKCPVCGGMLTVAIAVPNAPPAPPPAPIPKPHPVPKPILPPIVPPAPAPTPRVRHLAEPWPMVRNALFVARSATDFSLFLSGLFLVVGLLVLPFFPATERSSVVVLPLLGLGLVIPVVAHFIGQVVCINVPRRFGAWFAGGSVGVVVLAVGTLPEALNRGGLAVAVPAVFVLTSFGLWLAFLYRLGKNLRDEGLVIEVTAFPWGLGLGAIVVATMLTGAFVADGAGVRVLGWVGRVIAGATGLLLLYVYAALLRTAVAAVERRAPATR